MLRINQLVGFGSRVSAPVYDADAQAWFDAVSWGNDELTKKQVVSDFIAAGKGNGWWTKHDRLWMFANRDTTALRTCLKSLATSTLVNVPTVTQWQGVAGNGTNSYINSGYNPSSDNVVLAQNDNCAGIYSRTDQVSVTGSGCLDADSSIGMYQYYRYGSNQSEGRSCSNNMAFTTIPTSAGLLQLQRTGASASAYYIDGALIDSSVTTSNGRPNANYYFGAINNNGTPSAFSTREMALGWLGASMDSTVRAAWTADVATLKAGIGW